MKTIYSASPSANTMLFFLWVAVLVIGVWTRFHDIDKSGIWIDEAFSLLLSAKSPAEIFFHTTRDVHPPLYYWMLHGWIHLFGESVHAARVLSAIFGVLSVVLAMWLIRLLSSRRAMLLGGLLIALLPIAVRYSQEIRMYAFLATLMLSATIALVYWLENSRSRRPLILYCLLMVGGLYTHYFTVVCAFAHWLYLALLLRTQREERRYLMRPAWWVANIVISIMFIPWLPSFIKQLRYSNFNWIPPLKTEDVVGVFWRFLSYSDGTEYSSVFFYGLPVILFMISVAIVVKGEGQRDKLLLLVTFAWVPIALVAVVSLFKPLLIDRYLLFAAMAYPMTVAVLLDMLLVRCKVAFVILLGMMFFLEGRGLSVVYAKEPSNLYEFNQFNVLANTVNSSYQPGDGVLVLDFFIYLPMVYYFKSDTLPMYYAPRNSDGTSGRPDGYQTSTLSSEKADQIYVEKLGALTTASGRVWLIDNVRGGSLTHKLPDNWRLLQTFTVGEAKAELINIRPADAPLQTPLEPRTISTP
ncbi:glycosyltransferase family 39 protein [Pseudomonas sp. R2-7-07]|uniref:glycosyltransferase family 39 protein n=1 Tax=Pseudomonas sp. R2-7-07 TaxID=658641 RepID=UPI000F579457|nr:glycosyltransferase family 39 protein [Pseudomonas sp. R2-7-07]AZF46437.1 putative membrane protein [Pseudomonas sp. R2-7-07]